MGGDVADKRAPALIAVPSDRSFKAAAIGVIGEIGASRAVGRHTTAHVHACLCQTRVYPLQRVSQAGQADWIPATGTESGMSFPGPSNRVNLKQV